MEPFATVTQYEARFGSVSDEGILAECLKYASAAIRVRLDRAGIDYQTPTEDFAERLSMVCCTVANRIMPSGSDFPVGMTQASMTAVGFTESLSFTPTYGTPKLLPSELDLLGITGSGKGRVLYPAYGMECNAAL